MLLGYVRKKLRQFGKCYNRDLAARAGFENCESAEMAGLFFFSLDHVAP